MFIGRENELNELNDGESITWLISSTGYSNKDMENFTNTARDIGVNIEFFKDKDEFIYYINGKGDVSGSTQARDNDKISKTL